MKLMSYQKFIQNRAESLKRKRKMIGVTISEAEDIIFGHKHSVGSIERQETQTVYKSEYLNYIYNVVIEEGDFTDKSLLEIFRDLEFED